MAFHASIADWMRSRALWARAGARSRPHRYCGAVKSLTSRRRRTTDTNSAGNTSNSGTLLPLVAPAQASDAPYPPVRHWHDQLPHSSLEIGASRMLTDTSLFSPEPSAIRLATPMAPSNIPFNFEPHTHPMTAMLEGAPLMHSLPPPQNVTGPALPAFIRPLPARFGQDDITYLQNKGALTIPPLELRDELLRNYAEYMHPLMPLLDFHKLVRIVDQNDGVHTVSLLLFQAVMFTGVATVDMRLLEAAGYRSRREARRAFYEKARLLYDLDYEDDSIALIQALLLMTYWRESPHGRKETHYWIENAVSLAHKIGLHRNPEDSTTLEPWQQKLRKRIWWSAVMRDAQVSLGTRKSTRMTRMKDVVFDVPMLQLADFELDALSDGSCCIPADCKVLRDTEQQRQLAIICIEMAKLCLCIGHILSVQNGVTSSKACTWTANMLFPESVEPGDDQIQASARVLQEWKNRLPEAAQFATPTGPHNVDSMNGPLFLHRAYLHMLYYAVLSSLHRPQLVPPPGMLPTMSRSNAVDLSRDAVRLAANNITEIVSTLSNLGLVRYLPSPSITVILHALVTHLLDVLAPDEFLPRNSLQDFGKCMEVMAGLRDMYPAADYSTAFLQAAILRTEIGPLAPQTDEDRESCSMTGTDLRMYPAASLSEPRQMAPPPSDQVVNLTARHTEGAPASGAMGSDDNADHPADPSFVSAIPSSNLQFDHLQDAIHMPDYSQNLMFDVGDSAHNVSTMGLMTSATTNMNDHGNDFELDFDGMETLDAAGKMFNDGQAEFDTTQGRDGAFAFQTAPLAEMGPGE
ncbi:hypothetical protein AYO20_04210 [Fonsecaea nubica]|uniref:Xylanolytic transcriptional activator regulatory domain-containing protein n=1 Tax=Fonsecaea nubica TaxID=856822 RepID=A0A178D5G6_9EURO|nr:hypothetical protein AYO20_04210 [Fonsecaea nubica]OAL36594.1 hypothetical protein AYO20_04210 [Fonsecaea nubica]